MSSKIRKRRDGYRHKKRPDIKSQGHASLGSYIQAIIGNIESKNTKSELGSRRGANILCSLHFMGSSHRADDLKISGGDSVPARLETLLIHLFTDISVHLFGYPKACLEKLRHRLFQHSDRRFISSNEPFTTSS
jgi:hypothetical protein